MLKKFFPKLAASAGVSIILAFSPAQAEKVNSGLKTILQGAMMDYIDFNSIDGQFLYFNPAEDKVVPYYPANLHPMVLKAGEYFIICSDFKTADGRNVDVDFLAVQENGEVRVIQALIGKRDSVRRMMQAQKAAAS